MELELKVLTIIRQERPLENMQVNFPPCDTIAIAELRRKKRTTNLPLDFVPSMQGDYNKLELPEFVAVFLFIIKSYDSLVKDAKTAQLELLTINAISYRVSSDK